MIDCPVDGRKNIKDSICPQCGTDLSPLIYIKEMPDKYHTEGTNLLNENKFDESIKKLINAISLDDQQPGYYVTLGKAYIKKGLLEEAFQQIEKALELDSQNAEALNLKKSCEEEKKQREEKKRKDFLRLRRIKILVFAVPVIAFAIGIIFLPFIHSAFPIKPQEINHKQIADDITRYFSSDTAFINVKLNVSYSDSCYLVTGELTDGIQKNLVLEIIKGKINKDDKILDRLTLVKIPQFISYTVKSDDNFMKIAGIFFNDAKKWEIIYDANKQNIKNPKSLKVGQMIKIPIQ